MASDTGPAILNNKDREKIADEIEHRLRGGKVQKMEATSGGSGRNWFNLNSILQALVIAGILGLFSSISGLKDSISEVKETSGRLEVTINERGKQYDRDIQRIDATLERHDQRITTIERGQGTSQFNADNRQKR